MTQNAKVINHSLENGVKSKWYNPVSLLGVIDTIKYLQEAKKSFRLVAGNTSVGIFKDKSPCDAYIGLKDVKEFNEKKVLIFLCVVLTPPSKQAFLIDVQNRQCILYIYIIYNCI